MKDFIENLTGEDESDPNVIGEEYYELLDEIDQRPSATSVTYKSIESIDKGKIKYAEEELGLITGYPRNIMLTPKGYNQLLQYRISKSFERQNKILEESSELNEEMKEHTVAMKNLTEWILGFTVVNLILVGVQVLIATGIL